MICTLTFLLFFLIRQVKHCPTSEIFKKIIRNKFRKDEYHRINSAERDYVEKQQIINEILKQMNEKEAAIKKGELEEQRLTEEAMELQETMERFQARKKELQKRQKELELCKKKRVVETIKLREELSLLRRHLYLYAALSESRKARAKTKPRFLFCSFIVKILNFL